jgi:hypothetical protein
MAAHTQPEVPVNWKREPRTHMRSRTGGEGVRVTRPRLSHDKWVNVHTHEFYFRDTAHGFLVWAVGLVICAALLTSAAASVVGGTVREGVKSADGAEVPSTGVSGSYLVDALLRPSSPTSAQDNREPMERLASCSQTPCGWVKYRPLIRRTLLRSCRRGPESVNPMRKSESMMFLLKLGKPLTKLAKLSHI